MGYGTNRSVAFAVALALGRLGCPVAFAADEADARQAETLQTITVTAQRRAQNMQDVPIAMQTFTGASLRELDIKSFDDYVKYLPNVSAASNGPGQSEIFMRGLSAGSQASQGSGLTALFPNVAVYLDDQSVQLPNRNLDVYAADLSRIEILEGPQGTLFGSGAEAGVIRYITNNPVLDRTEGSVSAGYGVTAHGDPNTNLTAVLNLPLMAGKLAMRAVIYDDRRGGYIDNVPATFSRRNTDIGIHYANYPAVNGQCPDGQPTAGYCVPAGAPVINNYGITQRAINPVTYQGGRAELLYKVDDDWDILITQTYQGIDTQGVFYQQPSASDGQPLAPLEVTLFNPSYDKDRFENTAWTVHGRIGPLRAVYTGGYLDRHVDQVGDYTNYARGVYADYYQCYGPGSGGENLPPTCFSPSSAWHDTEQNFHQQHELRLSTPGELRLRGIVGAYYEDDTLEDQTDWQYKSIPPCTANGAPGTPGNSGCLSDIGTIPGTTVENPGVQGDTSAFYADLRRQVEQVALFASLDFDLVPHVLTVTAGTRHYRFDSSAEGGVTTSFYCFDQGVPATGCHNFAYDVNAQHLADTESGYRSRANLTWHVTRDLMLYYTWSQGFRPGGFNQNGGTEHIIGPDGQWQFAIPSAYHSDELTNNEIGWKSEWLDHRVQWNGAIYRESWNNVQIAFFDPSIGLGNLYFNTNGQNFVVDGIETSVAARVTRGLTVQAAASWNRSRQTNSPALIDNNPQSVNYGRPITESCDAAGQSCAPVVNPYGPVGSPTADSPPMQFSLRARYDWAIADFDCFVQAGATHTGHSFTQAGSNPALTVGAPISTDRLRFEDPAYTLYDASLGVTKGDWTVRVHGENLANSNAAVFTSADQFIVEQTPVRPRVLGVEFGYAF